MLVKRTENQAGDVIFFATGEDAEFKCDFCEKEIKEGFKCEDKDLVLCAECQKEYKMTRCLHDSRGEHRHIKFQRAHENSKSLLKLILGFI